MLTGSLLGAQNSNREGIACPQVAGLSYGNEESVQSHLWTQDVKDDLTEALPDFADTLLPEELEAISAAIARTPLDTLLSLTAAETERLNTEEVPLAERSDASLIFLLADLVYGPNRWNDSHEIEVSLGEWFLGENPN